LLTRYCLFRGLLQEKVEEPQGHISEGEKEGDGQEEWVSSRVWEEVEVLSDLGIPQPLRQSQGDGQ